MQKRVNIIYSGQVQGVGFRFTTSAIAKEFGIKGWVKNLPDGDVEVVAEGEEKILNKFIEEVKRQMNYATFKESINWMAASGGLNGFEIRFF